MARKLKAPVAPTIPPKPPLTPQDLACEQRITAELQSLVRRLEQRALDQAVALAQQAARRRGPLVAHFLELGRRFGETLNAPDKLQLRVVKGGKGSEEAREEARIEAAVAKHGSIIAAMRAGAI